MAHDPEETRPAPLLDALRAMTDTGWTAGPRPAGDPSGESGPPASGSSPAADSLAALLLLRQLRDRLDAWEPALIETARADGASWADIAAPLGLASRQAAERRYLRVREGRPGSTAEQRVRATRDRRAAARSVTAWARDNAAELRLLAGRIGSLDGLPDPVGDALSTALADDDPALLLPALAGSLPFLRAARPDLAPRVEELARHTEDLRDASDRRRAGTDGA
ncbi:type III effector protein [Streptomyces termitum]|uniref:type III effector protein n=1 Tax=Streptomyces termitum TaxID=67368 RepID=UPI0033BEF8D6